MISIISTEVGIRRSLSLCWKSCYVELRKSK